MKDYRAERLVNNEALFRAANERMADWEEQHAEEAHELYYCECADRECRDKVELSWQEYEAVRSRSDRFFVRPGHEIPEVESVIDQFEGYLVIQKNPEVADIAKATDRRAED